MNTLLSPSIVESSRLANGIMPYAFAWVAGYVDAHALIRYHVYASFMSGNTTRVGVETVDGHLSGAVLCALAIVFFVIGAFVGVAMLHSRHRRTTDLAIVIAWGLLVVSTVTEVVVPLSGLTVALLSASMGVLNSTVSRIGGQAINIGYVSGGLHKIAEHLAFAWRDLPVESPQGPGDTHLRRAALIASVWGEFLCGALLGAFMESHLRLFTMSLPIAAIFGVLLFRIGSTAPATTS